MPSPIVQSKFELPHPVGYLRAYRGEYAGIPPTGRTVSVPLCALFIFNEKTGDLDAERSYFHNATVLEQLKG
jgi:hypothetical protein